MKPDGAVRREGALALALGSALLGVAGMRLVSDDLVGALVLAVELAVLALLARSHPGEDDDASLTWTAVAGAFVALPTAVGAVNADWICLALFLAAPAGLVLATFWWTLMGRLEPLERGGSLEDPIRARGHVARWLVAVASVAGLVGALRTDLVSGGLGLGMAVAAAALAGRARGALRRRRRWLTRVREGRVEGWRIRADRDFEDARVAALPAFTRGPILDGVLVAHTPDAPYREGMGQPVARVSATAPLDPVRSGPGKALAAAAACIGAFFAPLIALFAGTLFAELLAQDGAGCTSDGVVGWLLLFSGPSTGAILWLLGRLHAPTRVTVWWLGLAVYLLVCPFVCLTASMAAAFSCWH
ncbi:MAG: hypothetical protein RLP09_30850 [Sandaracinaceae bacterium]